MDTLTYIHYFKKMFLPLKFTQKPKNLLLGSKLFPSRADSIFKWGLMFRKANMKSGKLSNFVKLVDKSIKSIHSPNHLKVLLPVKISCFLHRPHLDNSSRVLFFIIIFWESMITMNIFFSVFKICQCCFKNFNCNFLRQLALIYSEIQERQDPALPWHFFLFDVENV